MLKIFEFDKDNVEEQLSCFENKHNLMISESYKKFLLKYNGGNTPKTTFKIGKISSDIRAFFGFSYAPDDYNFEYVEKMSFFEDILENDYIPNATDSFGNFIVLGITLEKTDICFWDSELQSLSHLTDDLESFFAKVKSKKFVVRSVDERIQGMKDYGSSIKVSEDLIELWQQEINKYSGKTQVNVSLK